jgi:hypothetical protein
MSDDIVRPEEEEEEVEEEKPKKGSRKGAKSGSKRAKGAKGIKGPFKTAEAKKDDDTKNLKLTKEEEKQLGSLKGEEKEKWIIHKKMEENRWRQKFEMHEVSLEDEQLIGAAGPVPGAVG